jgi:hypothetical protein
MALMSHCCTTPGVSTAWQLMHSLRPPAATFSGLKPAAAAMPAVKAIVATIVSLTMLCFVIASSLGGDEIIPKTASSVNGRQINNITFSLHFVRAVRTLWL